MKTAPRPISSHVSLKADGALIKRVTIDPGRFPVNTGHKLAIVATLGGAWKMRTAAGKTIRFEHGEIWILPRGFRRQSTFYQTCDNLMLTFDDAAVKRLASERGIERPYESLAFGKVTDWTVRSLVDLLAAEMTQPAATRGAVFGHVLAYTILGCLLRHNDEVADGAADDDPRVHLARRHITRHLDGDLAVRTLARVAAMSESQFARSFKQSTGLTPHRFVRERRVAAAEYLVRTTPRPLHEIAEECGFQSQSHFSHLFAQIFGKTPSAVRTGNPSSTERLHNAKERP